MRLFFSRFLVAILFVSALSIGGCDVFSSSDSSPDWVGDWEITEFADEPTESDIYYSFGERSLVVTREPLGQDGQGCRIFKYEIENVEGNKVAINFDGQLETDRLEVNGETLTGTIVRSNFPNSEGETYRGSSVDADPKELVGGGCQQSAAKSLDAHPLR